MIRATHYALTCAMLALPAIASGPAPGTSDAEVVRYITRDLIADPTSALTFNGMGVRFVDQKGLESERQETIPPIPLPGAWSLLAGAIGALAWIRRIS